MTLVLEVTPGMRRSARLVARVIDHEVGLAEFLELLGAWAGSGGCA